MENSACLDETPLHTRGLLKDKTWLLAHKGDARLGPARCDSSNAVGARLHPVSITP